ncbi:hypothetical protein KKG72_00540 [bacterium]|nr:hypothetical protein [bacterium]
MKKYTLALLVVTLLVIIGCGAESTSPSASSDNKDLSVILHNQGESCLDCHGAGSEKEFISGATVYTSLDSNDSYADGYTIRLVLEGTHTVVNYIQGSGIGNSHTPYSESINDFTAQVLDSNGSVVNSSATDSHGADKLNCNNCHTAEGTGSPKAPGRITYDMTTALTISVSTVSSDTQTEGTNLVHTVVMSGASASDQDYTFTLGGGTADSVTDYSAAIFSNSVLNNGNGTITVPFGVTTFTITTPTIDDSLVESTETYNLNVGGITATGTILDNDTTAVAVSFGNDVMPILVDASKGNCIDCHATSSKRKFQVGDAAYTYSNIITNSFISVSSPDSSVLLIKGNGGDGHNGGDQLTDVHYKTIRDWIAEGGLEN